MEMWQAGSEPFLHLLLVLQQNAATLSRKHGPRTTTMSLLVTSKADSVFKEFNDVLRDDRWRATIAACMLQKQVDGGDLQEKLNCTVVSIVHTGIVEYVFRILRRTRCWPLRLMFLSHELPTVKCPMRQCAAEALLGEKVERLDSMSAKVRQRYRQELWQCSQDGLLDSKVWRAIETWKANVPSDMQANESGNSVLTNITRTAPGIANPLLSARFTMKQELVRRDSQQQCLDL